MAVILSLDTSSDICSVSLCLDGQYVTSAEHAPRKHAQRLLPMVRELLDSQNVDLKAVDAVAFGRGPGSFTGLRIAAGVAQGLGFGVGCPLVPVSNLQSLALQYFMAPNSGDEVFVSLDARMSEVYWASYTRDKTEDGGIVPSAVSNEAVSAPALIEDIGLPSFYGVGTGMQFADLYSEAFRANLTGYDETMQANAEFICRLAAIAFEAGEFCQPQEAAPVYVRDNVTWKKLPGRQ